MPPFDALTSWRGWQSLLMTETHGRRGGPASPSSDVAAARRLSGAAPCRPERSSAARSTRRRSAATWTLLGLVVAFVLGCGTKSQSSSTTTKTTTTAAATSTTNSAATNQPLSGSELERLIVPAPDPYAKVPDAELKTGLMEVGNPRSGEIGVFFAKKDKILAAGFQRGWERLYRAADRATIDVIVFEFKGKDGPTTLVNALKDQPLSPGYQASPLPGVPGGTVISGTSPEGQAAYATALTHGRFLVGLLIGGPKGAHDYAKLVASLSTEQLTRLPAGP